MDLFIHFHSKGEIGNFLSPNRRPSQENKEERGRKYETVLSIDVSRYAGFVQSDDIHWS